MDDKLLHFIAGGFVAGFLYALTGDVWMALLGTLMIGVGKEVWDHYNPPHSPDLLDVVATLIGWIPIFVATLFRTN